MIRNAERERLGRGDEIELCVVIAALELKQHNLCRLFMSISYEVGHSHLHPR